MKLDFFKMSGAGNDFVLLTGPALFPQKGQSAGLKKLAIKLCSAKTAVGADGLLYVNKAGRSAIRMRYFNSDGSEAFCGNGSRCSAWWAYASGLMKKKKFSLKSISGSLPVEIISRETVKMRMPDVPAVSLHHGGVWCKPVKTAHFLNTGVPHAVVPVWDLERLDVDGLGRRMRFHKAFGHAGANVDFVRVENGVVKIRTYERGVEAETLACGTGITASAVALGLDLGLKSPVAFVSRSGEKFRVWYKRAGAGASDIYIQGPAKIVFKGTIEI
ncbi:MAG TPA: diaminopimelate epimerase [Elusimicrobia bacterium]|nr:MAG: diaminopimelate epimerase [Elusimicrobia bacterium GWA2_51_34]HAF94632.1 diaminopimelate epimerase [Elusimicrobiota bacterium]HCE98990.1 diaminopimelate epimerase [Elusimicrobiota bacterium]